MRDRNLFITGAGGYVGRRLLDLIEPSQFDRIYRLVRKGPGPEGPGEDITGDLLDPASYEHALASCDTVVHLAAVTGKNSAAEYFRVNRDGTRVLVKACERAGVRRFLHVSTIAVTYPDLTRYHYAQAKRDAEDIVRASGLRYTIVRPTMIFGPQAPVLANLTKLALAPVVPIFGDGRAEVQPIHIDDLVKLILSIIEKDDFYGGIVEAGGPDILSIEDLLLRIRLARGGTTRRVVHLPVRIIEPTVALAGAVLRGMMPVTAGQLKALTSNGTANAHLPGMTTLDESLRLSFACEASEQLRNEARTYSRYLTRQEPSKYILDKYEDFHLSAVNAGANGRTAFDRFLVSAAARNPWMTRLADTYASRFCRRSDLRRKLVLLLGLLECAQPSAAYLDSPGARSTAGAWAALAGSAVRYVIALAASVFLLAPFHLALGARRTR